MKSLILLVGILLSSGCAAVNLQRSRSELRKSTYAYKTCVLANQDNMSKCAALKEVFEADLKVHEQASNEFPKSVGLHSTQTIAVSR